MIGLLIGRVQGRGCGGGKFSRTDRARLAKAGRGDRGGCRRGDGRRGFTARARPGPRMIDIVDAGRAAGSGRSRRRGRPRRARASRARSASRRRACRAHRFDIAWRQPLFGDERHIDIAVARAEAAMGEAADEIDAEQPLAERAFPETRPSPARTRRGAAGGVFPSLVDHLISAPRCRDRSARRSSVSAATRPPACGAAELVDVVAGRHAGTGREAGATSVHSPSLPKVMSPTTVGSVWLCR